ncbi:MAG: hypothetical protein KatS3mg065_0794 [Chloroflexota bacterium]|nr:MAG: hypothetical protein KatS3mg065_0794 [Chloroflexota bacterium]
MTRRQTPASPKRRLGSPPRRRPWIRCAVRGLSGAWLAALLLAGPVLGPDRASANGAGDLYVATRSGVAEVLVAGGEVLATIPLGDAPRALAFRPDGTTLYASTGGRAVVPIDIEALETTAPVALPGLVATLAHPSGASLVVALAADRRLALVDPAATTVRRLEVDLPGSPDLLAADRRHDLVLAAESGKSWLALLAGETKPVTRSLAGRVTAISVSPDGDLLVATRAPARIERLAPTDLGSEWSVDLPAAPDAVVALEDGVVVAGGRSLWLVDRAGARLWRSLDAPVVALAASDDGSVLYAATSSGVEALTADGARSVRIPVDVADGSSVLAPVPRRPSLGGVGGHGSSPTGGRVPATNTLAPAIASEPGLGPAIAVALVVLVLGLVIARRAVGPAGS